MGIISTDQLQTGLEKAKSYTDDAVASLAATDYVDEAIAAIEAASGTSGWYANLIDYDSVEAVEDVSISSIKFDTGWQSAAVPVAAGEEYTLAAADSVVCCVNMVWLDSDEEELSKCRMSAENGVITVYSGSTSAPDDAACVCVQWSNQEYAVLGLSATSSTDIALIGLTADGGTLTAYHSDLYALRTRVSDLDAAVAELEEQISALTGSDDES